MLRRQLLALAIGFVALLLANGLVGATEETETGESLIASARQGWRKYQEEISKVPIEVLIHYSSTIDGRLETDRKILVARDADRQRFESQSQIDEAGGRRKAGRTTTFILNPHYASELRRDSSAAPWKLIETAVRKDAEPYSVLRKRSEMSQTQLQWPVQFDGAIPLLRLCDRPGFKVTEFRRSSRDGVDLVTIFFVNPHDVIEQQDPGFFPISEGEITLHSNSLWCLDGYSVIYKSSLREMRMAAKLEYDDLSQRIPLPRKCVGRNNLIRATDTTVKTVASERVFEFLVRGTKPDVSQFYLGGYGLPEMPGKAEMELAVRRGWLPYLLGAVFVIGIVYVIRFYWRNTHITTGRMT